MLPSAGAVALREAMAEISRRSFRVQPDLSGSAWTEQHFHLERLGPWRWETAPYMRGIQDSLCAPRVPRVIVEKGNQIAGTTGGIIPMLGYAVHQRPARVLVYLPRDTDAKKFSRDKLTAHFRATPVLRGCFLGQYDDGLYEKRYAGGVIYVQHGGTATSFRQTDAEIVVLDDLDGFALEVGPEGDPWKLAEGRTRSYRRPKMVAISTPTLKDFSRIEDLFFQSDQRRYHVPCPHCRTRQVLRWGGRDTPYGFKWDSREVEGKLVPVFESIAYLCESCGSLIEERHKAEMVRRASEYNDGRGWLPDRPERSDWGHGFHLPQFVSLFPGSAWPLLLRSWYAAQGKPSELKTVVNQVFAETFEEKGEKLSTSELEGRAVLYVNRKGERIEVPDGVGILCGGVDVQHDRYEFLVRGYGIDWETWDIFHERVWGDPAFPETQARLRALLFRSFQHEHGTAMRLSATMMDSGYGAKAFVYAFIQPLERYNIFASKGDSGSPGAEMIGQPGRPNAQGVKLWTLGTFPLKQDMFRRLQVLGQMEDGKRVAGGPRFTWLRARDPEWCNGFDPNYFAGFGAEKLVMVDRVPRFVHLSGRANEPIDLHVLCDGAFRALSLRDEQMHIHVEAARKGKPPVPAGPRRRTLFRGVT